MCIAIVKPKGVSLPEDFDTQIRISAYSNDDGLGLALWRDGSKSIIVSKGYINNTEKFIEKVKSLNIQPEDILLLHARVSTHGNINSENCHPFIISKKIEECVLTETETKKPVVIHNGVLHKYADKNSEYSDTCKFANEYLTDQNVNYIIKNFPELIQGVRDLYLITDSKNKKYISFTNDFGGKIAILYPNGYLFTYGEFKENFDTQDGMLYSNLTYKSNKFKNFGGKEIPVVSQSCSVSNRHAVERTIRSNKQLALPYQYDSHSSDIEMKEAFFETLLYNIKRDKDDIAFVSNNPQVLSLFGSFSKDVNLAILTYKTEDDRYIYFYVNGNKSTVFEYGRELFIDNLVQGRYRTVEINKANLKLGAIYAKQLYNDIVKTKEDILILPGSGLRIYTKEGLKHLICKFFLDSSIVTEHIGHIFYRGKELNKTLELYSTFAWDNIKRENLPEEGTKGIIKYWSQNSIYAIFKFLNKNGEFRMLPIHREELIAQPKSTLIKTTEDRKDDIETLKRLSKEKTVSEYLNDIDNKVKESAALDEAMKVVPLYN